MISRLWSWWWGGGEGGEGEGPPTLGRASLASPQLRAQPAPLPEPHPSPWAWPLQTKARKPDTTGTGPHCPRASQPRCLRSKWIIRAITAHLQAMGTRAAAGG